MNRPLHHVLIGQDERPERWVGSVLSRENVNDELLRLFILVLELLQCSGSLCQQLAPEVRLHSARLELRDTRRAELLDQARDDVFLDKLSFRLRRALTATTSATTAIRAFVLWLLTHWLAYGRDPTAQTVVAV